MMVFWEQRLVVLATPKTGSSALETALDGQAALITRRPPELKHTQAFKYRKLVARYLEKTAGERFSVVALMREPVDWLGSWYRFRQRRSRANDPAGTGGLSFEEFVEAYVTTPRPRFAEVGSQFRFLSDGAGGVGVDRLFCYEEMDSFVRFLEERLERAIVLPLENVSPRGDIGLSAPMLARLRAFCPEDFDLYDRARQGLIQRELA